MPISMFCIKNKHQVILHRYVGLRSQDASIYIAIYRSINLTIDAVSFSNISEKFYVQIDARMPTKMKYSCVPNSIKNIDVKNSF